MGEHELPAKLVIVGVDAGDYNYVHRAVAGGRLDRFFGPLWRANQVGYLECDVRPMHSGPCWAQLFAGDTFGLKDFARGQDRARIAQSDRWLWAGQEPLCWVNGVPVALPPLDVNTEQPGWIETTLSITAEEMTRSTLYRSAAMGGPERAVQWSLVVSVWPALDRAGHIFGMESEQVAQQYELVDAQLAMHYRHWRDQLWVVVSDHGMTSTAGYYQDGWGPRLQDGRKGYHSPDGIIASNIPNMPRKLSEFYAWINGGGQDGE